MVGGEVNFWPPEEEKGYCAALDSRYSGYISRYCNGGLIVGSGSALLKWLDDLELFIGSDSWMVNQRVYNRYVAAGGWMRVDVGERVFYCCNNRGVAGDLVYDGLRVRSLSSGTHPNFVHFNGGMAVDVAARVYCERMSEELGLGSPVVKEPVFLGVPPSKKGSIKGKKTVKKLSGRSVKGLR